MNNRFRVHLNGTSAAELFEQHRAVLEKAQELEELLRRATPNARDYYVLENGDRVLKEAQTEFAAISQMVQDIQAWALEGAIHAQEQEGK